MKEILSKNFSFQKLFWVNTALDRTIVRTIVLALVLSGCGLNGGEASESFADMSADLTVSTAPARRGQLESAVDVAGVLAPYNIAVISAKMSGAVQEVNADAGQQVKTGDVLIRLETKELDAQLASARAAYNSAESQSKIAKVNLDAAQSGLNVTKAAVSDQVSSAKIALDADKTALDATEEQNRLQLEQSRLQIDQAENGVNSARNNWESAQDTFEMAQKNYDRTQQLVTADVSAQANLDSAQASLNTAQASLNAAQTGLEQAQTALQTAEAAYSLAGQGAKIALDAAQAKYDSANAAYSQASGSGAQSQIVAAQGKADTAREQYNASSSSALEQARTAVNVIEAQLSSAEIRANIDGVVVNKNINAGEIASPGSPLLTLADTGRLKLKGTIAQDALPFVKEGQEVGVSVDIYPDKIYPGSVTGVGPISVSTGSYFPCEITLDNADGEIAAGLSARASIRVMGNDRVCVPNAAIVQNNGQTYVFVIQDNTAVKKDVAPGLKNDIETEILRGLEEGEAVAVTNVNTIFDQMPVQTQEPAGD
ncbi:MAG: efflux RND transporter periplasmic adaptor subunit [Clostridiales bacterium]|nr:efflux RND transporter periplasmic adaptor subunit [Clostridiales bacterium]